MSFDQFGLSPEILRAVKAQKYETPTPIQEKAIPRVMLGKDLLGCAQTGTGKTAAFALPILHRLSSGERKGRGGKRPLRALVLSPTRELASQINESFEAYGAHTGLRTAVVFGGVSQKPQADALRRGVDILVATPGRLLDLLQQRLLTLSSLDVFVLDEADRMLDMGFIRDIRRIVDMLPAQRQTLFFSATMPYEIRNLADTILREPEEVSVAKTGTPAELIEQHVYYVEKSEKGDLLRHLLESGAIRNALVFMRTKHGAERLARTLHRAQIRVEAIHGDKTQKARERALASFKNGETRVLVATDVAARGIDINELSHVINYDLPNEPESYVHRIGRTGRAGATGIAMSFCSYEERPFLADIERLIKKHLKVAEEHPFRSGLRPGPPTNLEPGRAAHVKSPFMISAADLFKQKEAAAPPPVERRRDEGPGRAARLAANRRHAFGGRSFSSHR